MEINIQPVNVAAMFRFTTYKDDQGVTIAELMPITVHSNGLVVDDPIRQPTYEGLCFINGQPRSFKIEGALNLSQACEKFPEGVRALANEMDAAQTRSRILNANAPRAPR